ncbi:MAG: hypothetical protein NVSMB56_09330 [Pyrinomonadaceae bacterium]
MPITEQDVIKIAALAHLELTADEQHAIAPQLASIVAYVEQLNELDTSNVEPALGGLTPEGERTDVAREDVVRPSLGQKVALEEAPIRVTDISACRKFYEIEGVASERYYMTIEEQIYANAEILINDFRESLDVSLDYDEQSLVWLENYIERTRKEFDANTTNNLVSVFGSFLGECVRHKFGGRCVEVDGQWAICFGEATDKSVAYPFNKVRKFFERGLESGDSLVSFYKVIPVIFKFDQDAPS